MVTDASAAYGWVPYQVGLTLNDHILKAWHRAVDDVRCDIEEARPGHESRMSGVVYPAAAILMAKRHPDLMTRR